MDSLTTEALPQKLPRVLSVIIGDFGSCCECITTSGAFKSTQKQNHFFEYLQSLYLVSFIHFPLRHSLPHVYFGKLNVSTQSGKFRSNGGFTFICSTKDNCRKTSWTFVNLSHCI